MDQRVTGQLQQPACRTIGLQDKKRQKKTRAQVQKENTNNTCCFWANLSNGIHNRKAKSLTANVSQNYCCTSQPCPI